jgi:hypothetical protein
MGEIPQSTNEKHHVRLWRVLLFVPLEIIFWFGGLAILLFVFLNIFPGIPEAIQMLPHDTEEFTNVFVQALGICYLNIALYAILRSATRLKMLYKDMSAALTLMAVILSLMLNRPKGAVIDLRFGLSIGAHFIFAAVNFGAFSAAIAQLDKFTALKDWVKLIIALTAASLIGFAVSRLLWFPILEFYERK